MLDLVLELRVEALEVREEAENGVERD